MSRMPFFRLPNLLRTLLPGFACLFFVLNVWGQNDPLASGKWVTIKVKESGVLRLNKEDLERLGFDLSVVNPQDFRIFANMGAGYPAINGVITPTAPEVPLYIWGEEDGKFDPQDYLEFYIQGTNTWYLQGDNVQRKKHLYTDEVGVYLGYQAGQKGKRVRKQSTPALETTPLIDKGFQLRLHEKDLYNPLGMGNWWLGEKLGNQTLEQNVDLKVNPSADSTRVSVYLAAGMKNASGSIDIKVNELSESITLRANFSNDESTYPFSFHVLTPTNGKVSTTFKLDRPNIESFAHLDYIVAQSFINTTELKDCGHLYFKGLDSSNSREGYRLKFSPESTSAEFWDVTDPYNPVILYNEEITGSNLVSLTAQKGLRTVYVQNSQDGCGQTLQAEIASGDFQKFKYYGINNISNQTIYVCPPKYKNTLLNLDWDFINKDAAVVTTQEIYNQYSGGLPDLGAIRAFLRYVHDVHKDQTNNSKLKYVTLVGAASYDFRDRLDANTNDIPIYQSEGIQKTTNFCLDDYIGFLNVEEGDPSIAQSELNVVIGRIPARSTGDIKSYFDKITAYKQKSSLGPWRNRLTFVADDIDEGWEREFTLESEDYADYIQRTYPYLRVNRIYADAYAQQTNGNNEAYPEVTASIKNAFEEGSLFINYQGHGGESGWAQESIFDIPTINELNHKKHFPVLFTATCEFSRFDNPALQSAGEKTLVKANGGAIALMTTTRTVWSSGNSIINDAFWKQYGFPKKDEPIPTLGELYSRLKNRPVLNSEDYKFALLGDPSLKLAFPEHLVVLDSVNQNEFVDGRDTLKAFSVLKVQGHIDERLKGIMQDFNGRLYVDIYDKPIEKKTLDNDGVGSSLSYKSESSILFKGSVTVKNGRFEFTFAVPKDIAYQWGQGRAIFYADNGDVDAAGSWTFNIGGSEELNQIDSIGPDVRAFMGDTFYINGETVLKNSSFVARVFDESGLNSTGAGIGRDMVAILDPGKESEKRFILNDFFQYDPNSYQRGQINLPLNDLSPGWHTIECKVWDIYNNSGSGQVTFKVIPERRVEISENSLYPNPYLEGEDLHFSLKHNLVNEDINLHLELFSSDGRKLFFLKKDELNAAGKTVLVLENQIVSGISSGMYIYKLTLTSQDGLMGVVTGKWLK